MTFTPHACVWVGWLWKGPPCGPRQVRAPLLSMVWWETPVCTPFSGLGLGCFPGEVKRGPHREMGPQESAWLRVTLGSRMDWKQL